MQIFTLISVALVLPVQDFPGYILILFLAGTVLLISLLLSPCKRQYNRTNKINKQSFLIKYTCSEVQVRSSFFERLAGTVNRLGV